MYEMKSRVRFSEVDSSGRLSITSLIDYFQDVATFHADGTSSSLYENEKHNLGWMIFSWDIKIDKRPNLGDDITIQTMSVGYKGLYAFRDYILKSSEGVCATAHSTWSIIDRTHMLPKKLTDEIMGEYGIDEPLPGEWCDRKLKEPAEREKAFSVDIKKYHLDTNGHVNNQYYVAFALAAIDDPTSVKRVRVSYKRQLVFGDEVNVCIGYAGESKCVTLEKTDGTICAVVYLD